MKNLRSVDLNLLVALDAFVSECSVTRAANRLGLSQPAASNVLKRLRATFEDELLVRSAAGMTPTERAVELQRDVIPILRGVSRIFETSLRFDPAVSRRHFVMRMSDILEVLLLPQLLPRFAADAPQAALDIVHLSPQETLDALEGDRVDMAVSMGLSPPSSIRSRRLFVDRMVCVMRQGHRAAAGELTAERFLAERHVRVSISPTDQRFVDDILTREGMSRDVAFRTQHWTVLAPMLARTDFLAVMPASLAGGLGDGLAVRSLPFASGTFDWNVYWHRRHDTNPGHVWLKELLVASLPTLFPASA